ncbi:MAG: ATP synthase F1 subunit epsilon [Deltaproteobacteria bacterium]|nr:ATP synthase F1 subunit epsilon [Deltaproteobacteria bacterium]
MASLHLEVVTPRGVVVNKDIDEVTVPGTLGDFGILAGHIPVLSALRTGLMSYRSGNAVEHLALGGSGYAEVGAHDRVMVLTDESATSDDVDTDAVRAELEEAESELQHFEGDPQGADYTLLRQRADWARARLDLAGK